MTTASGGLTLEKALLRAAGEHAVVSELSRRGALAALVAEGARGVDILASKDKVRVTIQVKTKRPEVGQWILPKLFSDEGGEVFPNDADFFVLVTLGEPNDYWIVPTRNLTAHVLEGWREWVGTPGRGGRPHNPSSVRIVREKEVHDSFGPCHNDWESLWNKGATGPHEGGGRSGEESRPGSP